MVQGSIYPKVFTCLVHKISWFSNQVTQKLHDLENPAKIHLPDSLLYLPLAVEQ